MSLAVFNELNNGEKISNFGQAGEFYPNAEVATDDFAREVYGLLGIPIDASNRQSVFEKILFTAEEGKPFLLSTPNVNFMVESKRDACFRGSLLDSDLCCVDGMPIVWLARLLGIPITQRVSGSDLFETIRVKCDRSRPIKVFLFGGGEGVAQTVSKMINAQPSGMRCVGWLNPGFGTVAEMSAPDVIQTINDSKADLLAVFLNAKKAQSWLTLNHERLSVSVRGQFGATINYQAGTIRRAPLILQHMGLEWLWRIKEEPYLWHRYWIDGISLVRLTLTRALPIAIGLTWHRYLQKRNIEELAFKIQEREDFLEVSLIGHATEAHVPKSIRIFRSVIAEGCSVAVNVAQVEFIDPRYFGLLLMLRKQVRKNGKIIQFTGVSNKAARIFQSNGFGFLLEPDVGPGKIL